ncbi:MAG: Hsp20/alpha crystallin family protein [Alphaproteobacteria bacterium]|nr:Hsp20/alpha crystallin family protein [Alphaproteobacteria bacterium]
MNNFQRKIIPLYRTSLVGDPFNFLRQEIDRLFDVSSSLEGLRPQFDTKENDNCIEITTELPGVAEEDITLSLSSGILTVSGEKKSEEKKEGETYHITERQYGSFSRSLKLPYEPEQDDITASFKDGILKVTLPKPKEMKPDVHKIPIQKA